MPWFTAFDTPAGTGCAPPFRPPLLPPVPPRPLPAFSVLFDEFAVAGFGEFGVALLPSLVGEALFAGGELDFEGVELSGGAVNCESHHLQDQRNRTGRHHW